MTDACPTLKSAPCSGCIINRSSARRDCQVEVLAPREQTSPLVFSSPHSGRDYSAAFLAASALDPLTLRRSEDSFVDLLFTGVCKIGAPLIKANFPRAFCDPNREAYELDPAMFSEPLPAHVNTNSPRVAAGLGTIARVVSHGVAIYRHKLTYGQAARRIDNYYRPYHKSLARLVADTKARFSHVIVIDCHSMPSGRIGFAAADGIAESGNEAEANGGRGVDIVLGDVHGRSCAPALTLTCRDPIDRTRLSGAA